MTAPIKAGRNETEVESQQRLLIWLLSDWTEPEILLRDVLQRVPIRALRINPAARVAMMTLAAHGWLEPLPAKTVIRGKPRKEAWRIVRGDAYDTIKRKLGEETAKHHRAIKVLRRCDAVIQEQTEEIERLKSLIATASEAASPIATTAPHATTAPAALIPADALLLTDRQSAALLGMGRTTFWRHVGKGNLPQPVRILGCTRWNRAELEAIAAGKPAKAGRPAGS